MRPSIATASQAPWHRWLPIIGLSFVLASCAAPFRADPPAPGVPRISQLEIVPERVKAGCPARVRFHFEDSDGDIVRANAHWSLQQSHKTVASGYRELPIEPPGFTGKTSGEARARLTLERYGTYWYHVQVEDAAGHKSNVLRDAILVDAPWPWEEKPPQCK